MLPGPVMKPSVAVSVHEAQPAEPGAFVSSNLTRAALRPSICIMTLPVFQSTPSVGSPEPSNPLIVVPNVGVALPPPLPPPPDDGVALASPLCAPVPTEFTAATV